MQHLKTLATLWSIYQTDQMFQQEFLNLVQDGQFMFIHLSKTEIQSVFDNFMALDVLVTPPF